MNAGLVVSAPTFAMASLRVPSASGFTGFTLKPMWLSEICTNVNGFVAAVAASALPIRLSDFGTPPETVHRMPVPAQVMHSKTWRRVEPSSLLSWSDVIFDVSSRGVARRSRYRDWEEWRLIPGPRRYPKTKTGAPHPCHRRTSQSSSMDLQRFRTSSELLSKTLHHGVASAATTTT